MIRIVPSEKDTAADTLEKRLWDATDQLRPNSGLRAQEYSRSCCAVGVMAAVGPNMLCTVMVK